MSLAVPEDAASVLEQFTHDIANTPAEIAHLLEEIQEKDSRIQIIKDEINKRDAALQKWVRTNGGHVLHPKEEAFSETVKTCYDKCEILQAEKCGLSERALIVLDRQIKRLDIGLRGLQAREEFPSDWGGPSLLSGNVTGVNNPISGGEHSSSTPLQTVSGNIGTVTNVNNPANPAQIIMTQKAGPGRTGHSGTTTPVSGARNNREGSIEANKRRRLNTSLGTLPPGPSGLRQTSIGPGTPKAGTPNPTTTGGSRAGSAQPGRPGPGTKKTPATGPQPSGRKVAPHQVPTTNTDGAGGGNGGGAGGPGAGRQRTKTSTNGTNGVLATKKKAGRRSQLGRDRATPSTNASISDEDDESASPTPPAVARGQGEVGVERATGPGATAEDDDDDENDDQLYCYCQKVSFGNMVGCDNDNCEYQWFHWLCVGLKSEPEGEWLCPTCRKLPKGQVMISKA